MSLRAFTDPRPVHDRPTTNNDFLPAVEFNEARIV